MGFGPLAVRGWRRRTPSRRRCQRRKAFKLWPGSKPRLYCPAPLRPGTEPHVPAVRHDHDHDDHLSLSESPELQVTVLKLGLRSGFEPSDLDRPVGSRRRITVEQGLSETRLGWPRQAYPRRDTPNSTRPQTRLST